MTLSPELDQWLREAIDLKFYVEKGYLVVQEPAETESWQRRKRLEELLEREAADLPRFLICMVGKG